MSNIPMSGPDSRVRPDKTGNICTPESRAPHRTRRTLFSRWGWWGITAVVALGTDLGSTAWALHRLGNGPPVCALDGLIRLRLITNTGAAFGLGAGHGPIIAALGALGLFALVGFAFRTRSRIGTVGLGLAVGGALGNLAERLIQPPGLLRGPVIDWIHLSFYPPTFNLADMWLRGGLVLGVTGLLVDRRCSPSRHPEPERPTRI